jgi:hypothetical protein
MEWKTFIPEFLKIVWQREEFNRNDSFYDSFMVRIKPCISLSGMALPDTRN